MSDSRRTNGPDVALAQMQGKEQGCSTPSSAWTAAGWGWPRVERSLWM